MSESRKPVSCAVKSGRQKDASRQTIFNYVLIAALAISLTFNIVSLSGSIGGFGKKVTVGFTISEELNVTVWDGAYVDAPDYYVNSMNLFMVYLDTSFVKFAEDLFDANADAVLDKATITNETLGFGIDFYSIPIHTAGIEPLVGRVHSITMYEKIVIPMIILGLTNTTDTFYVRGCLESHFNFIDGILSETLNKSAVDEIFPDLFYDGKFDIQITGCQHYDSSISRILVNLNNNPVVLKSEFFPDVSSLLP